MTTRVLHLDNIVMVELQKKRVKSIKNSSSYDNFCKVTNFS